MENDNLFPLYWAQSQQKLPLFFAENHDNMLLYSTLIYIDILSILWIVVKLDIPFNEGIVTSRIYLLEVGNC